MSIMSNDLIVGHVSWSPDFRCRPESVEKLVKEGRLHIAPPKQNGAQVHVDIIMEPDAPAEDVAINLRPHRLKERSTANIGALLLVGPDTSPSPDVEFTYTNWKGETSRRRARFTSFWWGANEWHTEPQLLVRGFDLDKQADRTYAAKDISELRLI